MVIITSLLKNYWKEFAFGLIIIAIFGYFKYQNYQIDQKEAKIKLQQEELFQLETIIDHKEEEIYFLKQSQEILSESQDEFVIIENNYNNKVIENHKIVEKYFQDPGSLELLQKLYDLLNQQYQQMKLD